MRNIYINRPTRPLTIEATIYVDTMVNIERKNGFFHEQLMTAPKILCMLKTTLLFLQ